MSFLHRVRRRGTGGAALVSRGSARGTILDPSTDDSDTFRKAFVGYEVNELFAVEAGYADLGEVRTR